MQVRASCGPRSALTAPEWVFTTFLGYLPCGSIFTERGTVRFNAVCSAGDRPIAELVPAANPSNCNETLFIGTQPQVAAWLLSEVSEPRPSIHLLDALGLLLGTEQ